MSSESKSTELTNLNAMRAKLDASARKPEWRSLQELQNSKEYRSFLENEFPANESGLDVDSGSLDRRDVLKIMAASAAMAGLSACTKLPTEKIVPYVRAPEEIIPGKPLFYATSMPLQGVATGLLVESHMGRPTKIEGNPDHPGSLGGTDVFLQASVLGVYDPDRSQTVFFEGRISTWQTFVAEMGNLQTTLGPTGAGVRILTETVSSPTLAAQIRKLLQQFPEAKWYQYEPCGGDNAREGARMVFGRPLNTVYRVDQAKVIVSLDSDFLVSGPGHVRYTREFSSRRNIESPSTELNRLYAIESMPTSTGAMADHRLRLRSSDVEGFARHLASAIGLAIPNSTAGGQPPDGRIASIARDLQKSRGASLIIAGETQPPIVHALAHAMNDALANVGKTVQYTEPLEPNPVNQAESLHDLVGELNDGKVKLLVILGGNPVYDAPVDYNFGFALLKAETRIHCGLYQDETADLCNWHIPAAHYLESWGDARAYDGTVGVIQPLIAPIYDGHTFHEVVSTLTPDTGKTSHDLVKEYWQSQRPEKGQAFEAFWERSLHDGSMAGTALPAVSAPLRSDFIRQMQPGEPTPANELELVFRPDPTILDGRFANNGWLQETPKPITRLTWDNAAMMSPATAVHHGLTHGDYVTLRCGGHELKAGVFLTIGHAENAVTLHLGYGRRRAGNVGTGPGFNAYFLRTSAAPWITRGLQIEKTGKTYAFASVQHQWVIDNEGTESDDESVNAFRRDLVQVATVDEFRRDPKFAQVPEATESKDLSLYPNFEYPGYAWGMTIDLNRCVGCNACVVACTSENNVAVVGKDQVMRGRVMHWIRIDTYFHGGLETPEMYFEPLPCMQCENAPCEYVCPVGATSHSAEGLNDMTYNRCVGTRYCSNNCPYKVRRFNFYLYSDYKTPSLYGVRNPNVTVRSRGVMEKCTYCVQRINAAKIRSEEENRVVRDGEIRTACQQACPAEAIVFGNINDKKSQVSQLKAQSRNYVLLADLNTRPRTSYLARVRNPNPEFRD
ncbi:MAG TPA: TAT-variant-translocated molybdopterin oxidoreductase [Candidatus Limnocylindrales bacterium]|nr:TAT-variant-translocated molybdopterin oxidoreductase [Candidatus Limnocylindrales bacterium]